MCMRVSRDGWVYWFPHGDVGLWKSDARTRCPGWDAVGREDIESLVKRGYAAADELESFGEGESRGCDRLVVPRDRLAEIVETLRRLASRVEEARHGARPA